MYDPDDFVLNFLFFHVNREHFHCLDCHPRVFVKKEEMIRHFKWHKKRDESLANGFMRYSPGDDCNDRYRGCPHNRKQTHYHCVMKVHSWHLLLLPNTLINPFKYITLQSTCDKVYISTSDVQMHANYHRKDSAIMQEGFQRFRATEDCATDYCAFNGQRTTHFHCIRPPCNYTFKNKADMGNNLRAIFNFCWKNYKQKILKFHQFYYRKA